ncbi:MAG: response regulator [Eubacterium sp.]|nr:response regulator [Eubacterium sp.]
MIKMVKKHLQSMSIVLTVIVMGIIMAAGVVYVNQLEDNLRDNSLQNLMTVTAQQQQAFDNFIADDRDEVHDFAAFIANQDLSSAEEIRRLLTLHDEEGATYLAVCLDEGWVCSTFFEDIRQLDDETLALYRSFDGSGVRGAYTGPYSGTSRFGYYETFTFHNGHKGLIQKSYDRNKTFETFSLSFYNERGLSHVVNQEGAILLRPAGITENLYDSIFDGLSMDDDKQREAVECFKEALLTGETGSMTLSQNGRELIYTYMPVKNAEGWRLVSVISVDAISTETDHVFRNFQLSLGILFLLLFVCTMFGLLIWRTQRNLLEKNEEIEYQEQFFNSFTTYLASNTDDVYLMLDHETEQLEYVSPNVEGALGVKPEDLIEYFRASDMTADPDATEAYYKMLNSLRPGDTATPRNTERVNPKTGEHKYYLENAYCADIQGRVKRVAYLSDRTHERETQDSLAEALRMAQTANEAKSSFLSSVSHDIRTPMNAIIGFLMLLQDNAEDPAAVREYAQRIDAASQHLLSLINDVLDINKIESGSSTLNVSEINLAEIIEEINSIIRPQTKAKNQTFDIFAPHLTFEHLLGDKLRINQILINLLSNAVKYTPEGGTIQMRVEELPQVISNYSRVRFIIQDTGLGMSEDYQKVIFDPFTRESTDATQEIQGTGLGMAITKSLVDLMGGSIHVNSELEKGSTFTVELELRIQEQEDPKKRAKFWNDYGISRMIVADDDEDTCRSIVKAMAGTGVVTDYSTDGEKAVQMMRSARKSGESYDLILLDWMMPNLNGLETARLIRKNYSDKIPILLLTAYDWSEIEEDAKEIGINHFMPKPFFMTTFKEAVRRVMDAPKNTKEALPDVVRGRRIMVVDDIDANRMILVKILGTLGADCNTACNGQEAVDKFEASQPDEYDLILMDIQMPVLNGYDATRAIRNSSHPMAKNIPIIAMTANAFVEDVRDAIESGMDAHIAKPVQINNLKATIQQVFDNREKQAGETSV